MEFPSLGQPVSLAARVFCFDSKFAQLYLLGGIAVLIACPYRLRCNVWRTDARLFQLKAGHRSNRFEHFSASMVLRWGLASAFKASTQNWPVCRESLRPRMGGSFSHCAIGRPQVV